MKLALHFFAIASLADNPSSWPAPAMTVAMLFYRAIACYNEKAGALRPSGYFLIPLLVTVPPPATRTLGNSGCWTATRSFGDFLQKPRGGAGIWSSLRTWPSMRSVFEPSLLDIGPPGA
jgi:hypothetical protein